VVPTWNYITVHVEGRLSIISDKEWIQHNVSLLSEKHEGIVGSSWRVADAPSSYVDNLSRAIVGVEISITSMDAKFKLSQNKNEADVSGVIEGLRKTGKDGDRCMADWIEKVHLSDK
jgi:transcriptional regulator